MANDMKNGWDLSRPEDHGFDPGFVGRLDAAIAGGALPYLHGLVILGGGKIILERYVPGEDHRWGQPLGPINFTAETLHDLRSVSKSVVSLLYGIALAEGKVPAPTKPVLPQFPALADLAADPTRARLTVAHVLTMTTGLDWNEDLPYSDPRNSEIGMEMAADRYRFVLDRPFVAEPGAQWIYSGGATALLGHLIERGTGQSLLTYAQAKLFAPLGITEVDWVAGADGTYSAASGLRLRPRDLALIGQMILEDGRGIVPRDWLGEIFTPRIRCFDDIDYGYQWYLRDSPDGNGPRRFAMGNGGQRLILMPERKLVIAILCGRYNEPDQWQTPAAIMLEHVLPGLAKT